MLRKRIFLLLGTGVLIWLIYLLPGVVVENNAELLKTPLPEGHGKVPDSLASGIGMLRAAIEQNSDVEKNAIFADSLSGLYADAGKFDSAAFFAERSAAFFNNTDSWLKTGNYLYQAYTFAMDQAHQEQLAQKARFYLGKVVEADPQNLEAKGKMAMTYMSSSETAMQGIGMFREILAVDPDNEFALFNMGMLSIQSGQFDLAAERLEKLVQIHPEHLQGELLLGVAYSGDKQKEKAIKQFEKVKSMTEDPAVLAAVDSYLQDLNK